MGVPQTSQIVWDIRGSRMPFSLSNRADIRQLTEAGFGYAYREHSGYPPQDNLGFRRYFSSLQSIDPQPISTKTPEARFRQAYLIDKDSAVPLRALIDQVNARAAILSEDSPREIQAGVTELINVLGKVVAEIRVAEIRYPDGTTGFAPSRVVLNRGEEAVKAAIRELNTGQLGMPGERPRFQAGASSFHDAAYADPVYPSREIRIFGAIRLWGVLRYFDPYLSLSADKWDDVLVEFLPRVADAKDAREYHLAIAEMAARSGDPWTNATSAQLGELFGIATAPVEVRSIEGQFVVTRQFKTSPLAVGDVILQIEGKPVQSRMDELSRFFPGRPNLPARYLLATGAARTLKLTVQGKDGVTAERAIVTNRANQTTLPVARTNNPMRLIDERTGYVDVERIDVPDIEKAMTMFKDASAIIFDLRGYPRNLASAIATRLSNGTQPVAAELFRNVFGIGSGDSFVSFRQADVRIPRGPKSDYKGKTIALIDDLSGEGAMYLKAASGATLIGSPAFPVFPGSATAVEIPGGIKITFSGEIPRWPGGKLVAADGMKPDIPVSPTLAGIRANRDEVLEAALKYLAGS